MTNERQPPHDDLTLAVQIMAGLLASGHFTEIDQDGYAVAKHHHFNAKAKNDCPRNFYAATEAMFLLEDIKERMEVSRMDQESFDHLEREYLTPPDPRY